VNGQHTSRQRKENWYQHSYLHSEAFASFAHFDTFEPVVRAAYVPSQRQAKYNRTPD
jgi:hypothetical protein